eukprot:COSAG06_NODE_1760_length_8452_cov_6.300012_11_plen_70_part_00
MAGGGAHAWNYLVAGDDLYIEHYPFETTDGQIQTGKMLITHMQVVDRLAPVSEKCKPLLGARTSIRRGS